MLQKINNLKTGLLVTTVLITLAAIMPGCSSNYGSPAVNGGELSGFFNIIGSNTITPLTSVWAEEFMKMNPRVNIAVSGPGSGAGIAALINGTTDICQASRPIKQKEIEQAQANGVEPYEIQVANDVLSIVVHPSNPVFELTITQLSAIFSGKITNWQEVGGTNATIVVLSRDTNSGTHVFFKEQLVQMKGLPTEDTSLEYGPKVLFLPSTEQGVSEVARNTNAIFYPGLGYVSAEVKLLAIKKTADEPAVLPGLETGLDGSYPIVRPLFYYTDGEPTGITKDFIIYCLSPEGQAEVIETGYVPLR